MPAARGEPQDRAETDPDRSRREPRPTRLGVDQRDEQGHGQREAEVLDERPDKVERGGDVHAEPSAPPTRPLERDVGHTAFTTVGTRAASVNTITRSPGCSVSSPRGKIALPSRTIAPISAPVIGNSRNGLPSNSLSGRTVMSSTS